MSLTDLSPYRLIALSFAGYAIATSGFVLMASRQFVHLAHRVGFLAYLLPCFALIGLGVMVGYKAATAIGDGVRLERWSQDELRTPRRILEHPVRRTIEWISIALAVGVLLVGKGFHNQGLGFMYFPILYFTFWTSGIRRSLKEPGNSKFPESRVLNAPLQSQHWGH
jgi:hypothetical protein